MFGVHVFFATLVPTSYKKHTRHTRAMHKKHTNNIILHNSIKGRQHATSMSFCAVEKMDVYGRLLLLCKTNI